MSIISIVYVPEGIVIAADIKTCGGPIDVLVMTKDEAFWYKNKLKEA